MHACPQTKHRYEYLAANDTHRDQCHTQYQTNPPRHGFLGGSSQELAAACAASADLAAQRRGSPGRTPSSRSCPRAAAEAPVPCTRRHSSKERRKKLAPGPRAASARSAGVNGMPPWRLLIFEVISRTVVRRLCTLCYSCTMLSANLRVRVTVLPCYRPMWGSV